MTALEYFGWALLLQSLHLQKWRETVKKNKKNSQPQHQKTTKCNPIHFQLKFNLSKMLWKAIFIISKVQPMKFQMCR